MVERDAPLLRCIFIPSLTEEVRSDPFENSEFTPHGRESEMRARMCHRSDRYRPAHAGKPVGTNRCVTSSLC
jgi:hypothetical protein